MFTPPPPPSWGGKDWESTGSSIGRAENKDGNVEAELAVPGWPHPVPCRPFTGHQIRTLPLFEMPVFMSPGLT